MKIVVLDGYTENPGDISWGPIEALGEVTVYDRTAYEESPLIAERIGDADVIVINKTPISKETMDKCPNLKAIAVLATGYNVVDYEYAKTKGIPVMNVPVYGTDNVSQFAVSLLLEVCSHIGHHSDSVYAGEWAENADWCYWHYPMIEVSGKTAGIIGLGRIGRDTASLCTGIGMKVAGYDPFLTKEQIEGMGYEYYANYEDLLKDCDVISIHVPLTKETENMVSAKQLKEMKNTAIIINCSRGGIINEADLIEALDSGEIAGAGLDVFVGEEIHPGNPLLDAKNLIFSPHSAAQTREAVINMATMCVEGCKAVCAGKKWKLVANPDVYKHEKWKDAEWA